MHPRARLSRDDGPEWGRFGSEDCGPEPVHRFLFEYVKWMAHLPST